MGRRYIDAVVFRGALILGAASACGGEVTAPSTPEEEPVTVESSPWLLTAELPPSGRGRLAAQRFKDWRLERIELDPSARSLPSWSPSAEWVTYETQPRLDGGSSLWIRRLDGDVWGAPLEVQAPGLPDPRQEIWSPTSDRLLVELRDARSRWVGVVTPRLDAPLARKPIEGIARDAALQLGWSPSGDRVVAVVFEDSQPRITIHTVGSDVGDERPAVSHELVPPPGMQLLWSAPPLSSRVLEAVSRDGRWFGVRAEASPESPADREALYAFPMAGDEPARELTACSGAANTGGGCEPWSWHPRSATLLVRRARPKRTLEAWNPETDVLVNLGELSPERWLGSSGRVLARPSGENRYVVVDLEDVSKPSVNDVPTTELASFRHAVASPDGRWIVVSHADGVEAWVLAFDLHAPPPWMPRELARMPFDGASASAPVIWSSSGSAVLVEENTRLSHRKRVRRIDVATGAATVIESVSGRQLPAHFVWRWEGRLAPDDGLAAIGRDGTLTLQPVGEDAEQAAKLAGTPDWAAFVWRPSPAP